MKPFRDTKMKTFRQFLEETREKVKISTISPVDANTPLEDQETPEQRRHWDEEDHIHHIMRSVIDSMTNGDISIPSEVMKLRTKNPEYHKKIFDTIHSHMSQKFGPEFTPVHTELALGRAAR